ncbi:MAG: protein-export chaperone SecB [Bacteroidales bacterium]|nr:protein-export chaperone SecB [Bacteroidales bacterium]
MKAAAFSLLSYHFPKAVIDLDVATNPELDIKFSLDGIFFAKEARYELHFDTRVTDCVTGAAVAEVACVGNYGFEPGTTHEAIPRYFYLNALAILFPYVRAFISTLTLQANVQPTILLPTLNLESMNEELEANTKVVD